MFQRHSVPWAAEDRASQASFCPTPRNGAPPHAGGSTSPRSSPRGSVAWAFFAGGGGPRTCLAAPCGDARGVFQRHSVALTRESPFYRLKIVEHSLDQSGGARRELFYRVFPRPENRFRKMARFRPDFNMSYAVGAPVFGTLRNWKVQW